MYECVCVCRQGPLPQPFVSHLVGGLRRVKSDLLPLLLLISQGTNQLPLTSAPEHLEKGQQRFICSLTLSHGSTSAPAANPRPPARRPKPGCNLARLLGWIGQVMGRSCSRGLRRTSALAQEPLAACVAYTFSNNTPPRPLPHPLKCCFVFSL